LKSEQDSSVLDVTISLNGGPRSVPAGSSVTSLVEELGLDPARIAIEFELNILPRGQWSTTTLTEGSRLEIVHFVGGG